MKRLRIDGGTVAEVHPLSVNTRIFLLVAGLTLTWTWLLITLSPKILPYGMARWLFDHADLLVYFKRGEWLLGNPAAVSEYPQVPTFLFGINRVVSAWFGQGLQEAANFAIFSLEMMVVLFMTLRLILKLVPVSESPKAMLLFLPPTIFFTYNRFDILPAFFCLAALALARDRRWSLSAILLAIATLTKWYPLLLFPGFFLFARKREKKTQWGMAAAFAITSFLIVLPAWLAGGWQVVLQPYMFHTVRGMEYAALPVLVNHALRAVTGLDMDGAWYFAIFFALQFLGVLACFSNRLDSLQLLSDYSIAAIGFFVLFARIYSPQWVIWLFPFLVISARDKLDILLLILYSLLCYLGFPVFFHLFGGDSLPLQWEALLMYSALGLILWMTIKRLLGAAQVTGAMQVN